jgi:hypothetical protein
VWLMPFRHVRWVSHLPRAEAWGTVRNLQNTGCEGGALREWTIIVHYPVVHIPISMAVREGSDPISSPSLPIGTAGDAWEADYERTHGSMTLYSSRVLHHLQWTPISSPTPGSCHPPSAGMSGRSKPLAHRPLIRQNLRLQAARAGMWRSQLAVRSDMPRGGLGASRVGSRSE